MFKSSPISTIFFFSSIFLLYLLIVLPNGVNGVKERCPLCGRVMTFAATKTLADVHPTCSVLDYKGKEPSISKHPAAKFIPTPRMAKKENNTIKAVLVITKGKRNAKSGRGLRPDKKINLYKKVDSSFNGKNGIPGFASTDGSEKNAKTGKLDAKNTPNFSPKKVIIKVEDKDATDSSGQTDNSDSTSHESEKSAIESKGSDGPLMNIDEFAKLLQRQLPPSDIQNEDDGLVPGKMFKWDD